MSSRYKNFYVFLILQTKLTNVPFGKTEQKHHSSLVVKFVCKHKTFSKKNFDFFVFFTRTVFKSEALALLSGGSENFEKAKDKI